jgi:hypothetical protein
LDPRFREFVTKNETPRAIAFDPTAIVSSGDSILQLEFVLVLLLEKMSPFSRSEVILLDHS